ncbi:hypothetical protein [Zunongwangia pacifica]|nr:hypothetical protein [Zunongwangia pacifica]
MKDFARRLDQMEASIQDLKGFLLATKTILNGEGVIKKAFQMKG